MAVISFSPLQWLFWYDRPSDYHGEPEIEFFEKVPTVWDDTRVLQGEIGEFASIARRNGDDWFIGTINNGQPRELKLPLNFLAPGKEYTAHVYVDDDSVATRTKVGVETRTVNSATVLAAPLKAAGGQAIWLSPK
jgi:alpha-glucosidase